MLDKMKIIAQSNHTSKANIAKYMLDHLANIEKMSLEDLAKNTYTSKSSIVRFAQSFGFKGWTDFLPALISERYYSDTHYSNVNHNLPFSNDDSIEEIIQKIATIEKESIQDTADKLVASDVDKIAMWLKQANRVVVFGLSPNEYLAQLFKRKMLTIGKQIEVAHSGEVGLTTASLNQDDVAIVISYSGNSKQIESLRYLSSLKEKKVKIVGVTSEQGKYLRENAEITLTICNREDKYKKIANFSTEESILFILNTIYATYFKKNYFENYIRKINLSAELENQR